MDYNRQTTDTRLAKLQLAFDSLREMDREMPGQVVSAFLFIASHDGCHLQALTDELGLKLQAAPALLAGCRITTAWANQAWGSSQKQKIQPTAGARFCGLPTKGRPWPINSRRQQRDL